MTKKNLQLIMAIVCFSISVCLTSAAQAASSSGNTSWSNSYQQFGLRNWKFGIDPFPFDNGELFMEYDPTHVQPSFINLTEDLPGYTVVGTLLVDTDSSDTNNLPSVRVQFERTTAAPIVNASGEVEIFNIFFDDLDKAKTAADGHGPFFTLRGGGFDYPGGDFSATPETLAIPFSGFAVPEPSSSVLLLLGLAALLFRTRGHPKIS